MLLVSTNFAIENHLKVSFRSEIRNWSKARSKGGRKRKNLNKSNFYLNSWNLLCRFVPFNSFHSQPLHTQLHIPTIKTTINTKPHNNMVFLFFDELSSVRWCWRWRFIHLALLNRFSKFCVVWMTYFFCSMPKALLLFKFPLISTKSENIFVIIFERISIKNTLYSLTYLCSIRVHYPQYQLMLILKHRVIAGTLQLKVSYCIQ